MALPAIKHIVKGNTATFDSYRKGTFYYRVEANGETYQFTIEEKDLDGATLMKTEKAIMLMRYIRKSIDNETFIKLG